MAAALVADQSVPAGIQHHRLGETHGEIAARRRAAAIGRGGRQHLWRIVGHGGEVEDNVVGHGVGRAVLVDDLVGVHGHSAGFAVGEIDVGVERVVGAAAADRERVRTAGGTGEIGPIGRQRDRFAEVDIDVGGKRDAGGVIGRLRGGHGRRHVDRGAEAFARVAGTEAGRGRSVPVEVGVLRTGAGQLQGFAHGRVAGFADADVGALLATRRAIRGGKRTLVAEELHHHAPGVHQCQAVGSTVLDLSFWRESHQHAIGHIGAIGGDTAGQRDGVVRLTVVAVVQHHAPVGEVGADRAGDLDSLVGIGAGVVVMQLIDEYRRSGHGRARHRQPAEGRHHNQTQNRNALHRIPR
jgi:hypothetical protein